MSGRLGFEHVVLRAVPRVERGELVNVGVVLHCQAADFLGAAVHVDRDRLLALDPAADVDAVCAALDTVRGSLRRRPGGRPVRRRQPGERFRRLAAPRSTVVQPGPIHGGVTDDPAAELDRLLDRLVR